MSVWDDDRKIIDAATAGPWIVDIGPGTAGPDVLVAISKKYIAGVSRVEDALFTAKARVRWSAALDEIARLRKELSTIRAETTDALNDNYVSRNLVEHINSEVTAALQGEPHAD